MKKIFLLYDGYFKLKVKAFFELTEGAYISYDLIFENMLKLNLQ